MLAQVVAVIGQRQSDQKPRQRGSGIALRRLDNVWLIWLADDNACMCDCTNGPIMQCGCGKRIMVVQCPRNLVTVVTKTDKGLYNNDTGQLWMPDCHRRCLALLLRAKGPPSSWHRSELRVK